jgi:hypothetical protein
VEVKNTGTPLPGHAVPVRKWLDQYGGRTGTGLVVANVDRPMPLLPGVTAIPWHWI